MCEFLLIDPSGGNIIFLKTVVWCLSLIVENSPPLFTQLLLLSLSTCVLPSYTDIRIFHYELYVFMLLSVSAILFTQYDSVWIFLPT